MNREKTYKVFFSDGSKIYDNNFEITIENKDIRNLTIRAIIDVFFVIGGPPEFRFMNCFVYNQDKLLGLKLKDFNNTKKYDFDTPLNDFPSDNIHLHFF